MLPHFTRNILDKYNPSKNTQHLDKLQQEQYEKKVDDLNTLNSYCTPETAVPPWTDGKCQTFSALIVKYMYYNSHQNTQERSSKQ